MSEPFAYDVVDYPSAGMPHMHPSHLFVVARMFGCRPTAVDGCRFLELGCGDGTHLIACALGMPDATFIGVDLSAAAVARGRQMAADMGVSNVQLHAADITAWSPPAAGFDYACAHGLYSWVPAFVRDAVLAAMHSALAPHGVGYVSYNTYPGCYVRRMVWEMMRHHTANTADPARKLREATDLLKFLLAGQPEERQPQQEAFATEMVRLLADADPSVLYHDDLGAVNDPVYFHQFVAHAGRFGLRFVAEAEHVGMDPQAFPPAVAGVLEGMAARDVCLREQYIDFLRLRRFRKTLLAKDGRPPQARPDPAAAADLLASSHLSVVGEAGDPNSPDPLAFRREHAVIRTGDPLAKAALLTLAEGGPRRVPFDDLLAAAVRRLGRAEPTADDHHRLCGVLTETWTGGMVDLHGHSPRYFDRVSERPTACPFARTRAPVARVVNSRLFNTLNTADLTVRRLLPLLDGTRTVDQIAAEWAPAFPPDDQPAVPARLDDYLRQMARNGMLVG